MSELSSKDAGNYPGKGRFKGSRRVDTEAENNAGY